MSYNKFVKTAAFAKVDFVRMPPTEDGKTLFAYLIYLPVQKCLGLKKDAIHWGWNKTKQGLIPTTMMSNVVAPFLTFLLCRYKKGFGEGE